MKNKSPSSEVPLLFQQSREENKCEQNTPKSLLLRQKIYIQPLHSTLQTVPLKFRQMYPHHPAGVFRATSKCPCHAARCKAVRPAALGAETLLRPQRRCAVVPWPWRAARCKAVEPLRSGSSSAPPAGHPVTIVIKWSEMGALCKYVPEIKFQ